MKTKARETLPPTMAKSSKTTDYVEALTWLMSDPKGRRLMRTWIRASGVFVSSYEGSEGRDAAYAVAFNEGRKEFGYKRLAELKRHVPEFYLLMEKEGLDA